MSLLDVLLFVFYKEFGGISGEDLSCLDSAPNSHTPSVPAVRPTRSKKKGMAAFPGGGGQGGAGGDDFPKKGRAAFPDLDAEAGEFAVVKNHLAGFLQLWPTCSDFLKLPLTSDGM